MYIVCIRERLYLCLMCTFKNASTIFEVKVDIQKRALRTREKIDNKCAKFIQLYISNLCCHMVMVPNDYYVYYCRVL